MKDSSERSANSFRELWAEDSMRLAFYCVGLTGYDRYIVISVDLHLIRLLP